MNRQAFTLVELAVVLVIIGLIVGGVLTGRDLVHEATVRKQINQFREFAVAYSTFQAKYNCIPGDCLTETGFLAGVTNGNGNGYIENNTGQNYDVGASWALSNEYQSFFIALSQAGMVSGKYTSVAGAPVIGKNLPRLILQDRASFFVSDISSFDAPGRVPTVSSSRRGTNWIWAVVCAFPLTDNMQTYDDFCGVFLPDDMRRMDEKLDDGYPLSGQLIGFGGYSSNNQCVNSGPTPARYDLTYNTAQCQAAYQLQ